MAVRIRLQRHGKKGKPFYWIVAADSRSKRDGKYLEKIGTYDPNVNPPIVNLDIDATVKWIQFGAQPSDTARNIISREGALLKNHLLNGVKKGALTQEDADKKFDEWVKESEKRAESKLSKLEKDAADKRKKAIELEKEASEKRKLAAEQAALDAEAAAEEERRRLAAQAAARAKTGTVDQTAVDFTSSPFKYDSLNVDANTEVRNIRVNDVVSLFFDHFSFLTF